MCARWMCFFFQAEDGIRDLTVTGVQTCALPISIVELRTRAHKRVDQLKAQGVKAELYGADPDGALGGLNSFYLLVDEPEVYGLPRKPQLPTRSLTKSAGLSVASAAVLGVLALVGLRERRMDDKGGPEGGGRN